MGFSHARSMALTLHRWIMRQRDELPVAQQARLAGCSASQMYAYAHPERCENAAYILNLISARARSGDYSGLALLLPPGDRIVRAGTDDVGANGCVDDELGEAIVALAEARASHLGRNPDELAAARAHLHAAERGLEAEELLLRAHLSGISAA